MSEGATDTRPEEVLRNALIVLVQDNYLTDKEGWAQAAMDAFDALVADRDRLAGENERLAECLTEACDWIDPDGADYHPPADDVAVAVAEANRELVAHWRAALSDSKEAGE